MLNDFFNYEKVLKELVANLEPHEFVTHDFVFVFKMFN
jgi:hypothetical protein